MSAPTFGVCLLLQLGGLMQLLCPVAPVFGRVCVCTFTYTVCLFVVAEPDH